MSNKELLAKIKTEIEKQIKDPLEHCYGVSSVNKLRELLDFIDTLELKKPVPKDLEEYASRAGFDYVDNIVQENPGHRFNDHDVEFAYRDGFIAGAKWQAEQLLKSSPLPEDTVIYNKGVEEGKRLMLEEAVEGEILLTPYPTICLDDCKDYDFKDGQKVRVIIVKED